MNTYKIEIMYAAALFCLMAVWPAELRAIVFNHNMDSLARKTEITIDGDDYDWRMIELEQYKEFYIGFMNDDNDLYVFLGSREKGVKEEMTGAYGQTFTVWFDPSGKKGKNTGIRFYLKKHPMGTSGRLSEEYSSAQNLTDMIEKTELIRPGAAGSTAAVSLADENISAALGAVRRQVQFELKIPIKLVAPVEKKGRIGVGFEISDLDNDAKEELNDRMDKWKAHMKRAGTEGMPGSGRGGRGKDRSPDPGDGPAGRTGRDLQLNYGQDDGGMGGGGSGRGRGGGRGNGQRGGGREHVIDDESFYIPGHTEIWVYVRLAAFAAGAK